jgi:hypothetical protein
MSEWDDYKVLIDDLELEDLTPITKSYLIEIFNEAIKINPNAANTKLGVEIDVKPKWKQLLQDDGSILRDYEKIGWRVMWYRQKHSNGSVREWLSFKNPKYKGVKK